jgi:hypothetical protein
MWQEELIANFPCVVTPFIKSQHWAGFEPVNLSTIGSCSTPALSQQLIQSSRRKVPFTESYNNKQL